MGSRMMERASRRTLPEPLLEGCSGTWQCACKGSRCCVGSAYHDFLPCVGLIMLSLHLHKMGTWDFFLSYAGRATCRHRALVSDKGTRSTPRCLPDRLPTCSLDTCSILQRMKRALENQLHACHTHMPGAWWRKPPGAFERLAQGTFTEQGGNACLPSALKERCEGTVQSLRLWPWRCHQSSSSQLPLQFAKSRARPNKDSLP